MPKGMPKRGKHENHFISCTNAFNRLRVCATINRRREGNSRTQKSRAATSLQRSWQSLSEQSLCRSRTAKVGGNVVFIKNEESTHMDGLAFKCPQGS
jgi:hypothetical protein